MNNSIVKCDFRRLFIRIHLLKESAIGVVLLLLDGGAELQQGLWHFLLRRFENIDQTAWN